MPWEQTSGCQNCNLRTLDIWMYLNNHEVQNYCKILQVKIWLSSPKIKTSLLWARFSRKDSLVWIFQLLPKCSEYIHFTGDHVPSRPLCVGTGPIQLVGSKTNQRYPMNSYSRSEEKKKSSSRAYTYQKRSTIVAYWLHSLKVDLYIHTCLYMHEK